ncbi:MAG: hypothetical protein M1839_006230 [Geoglossum umbratile]|nr:MAG: hypothetical protein M1839_006230 [Geoglossum umbratile]
MNIPGGFPDLPGVLWCPVPDAGDADEDVPRRAALKEEYVSPEWKAWREGNSEASRPQPPVDIIAVQGLASAYERTWTKKAEDGTKVMWLKDLLPEDLPCARILTFEYNSNWIENPANVDLEQCAHDLLQAIIWDRSHRGEKRMCKTMSRRPLIFVGHSYGGLVIKQAMVCAAECKPERAWYDNWQSIVTSVSGIIYLGTPHDGSRLARYGIIKTKLWTALGRMANPKLLKPLELGSGTGELHELQMLFQEIRVKDRLTGLRVFYFWETLPCKIGDWEISEVVDEFSACLGARLEECEPLESDHKGMNKFASREESNYRKVRDRLQDIYDISEDTVGRRWGRYHYDGKYSSDKLEQLRNWLNPFESTASREQALQNQRFEGTCEWTTRLDVVSQWLNPDIAMPVSGAIRDGRCLWIHGKPGSGKSVLSAFLHDRVKAVVAEHNKRAIGDARCSGAGDSPSCAPALAADFWTALYFPFHGGAKFGQAVVTLVHQLLQQHPENKALHKVTDGFQSGSTLTPDDAVNLLLALVKNLSITYIIIDGLDECAHSEVGFNQYEETENMMNHLERLCQLDHVRLLMLSRKELVIEGSITKSFCSNDSILDMASHNSSDINLFIDIHISSLADTAPLSDNLRERIQRSIVQQSRGMFQWVKLVIQQLKVQVEQNGNEEDIIEMLEKFPTDLNEAYRKTFNRLSLVPGYNKERAVMALKWLACARRPLTLHELSLAIRLHKTLEGPAESKSGVVEAVLDKVSCDDEEKLEKEFSLLLGPLAEFHHRQNIVNVVDSSGNYRGAPKTISICHHSLTQFLVIDEPGEFRFPGRSAHSLIAATCMKMMCARNAVETFLSHYYVKDRGNDIGLFLDYAVENWSHHLRASGIRYGDKGDLTDLTVHVLGQNLELSLLVMGALSEACNRLNSARVGQMMQAIAVRDCQAAILPTVNAVVKLRPLLPKIATSLRDVNAKLQSKGLLKAGTFRSARLRGENTDDAAKVSLSDELDSRFTLDIFSLVDSNPELFEPIREQLKLLRETSRKLRGLTIRLSVDPIRSWLDHQIGPKGVSPVPALALTTHILDVLLASSLLPTTSHDRSDFRDQFFAEKSHPLYGFIVSTRYCLDERWKDVLTPTDYKQHVLGHYLLRKPEWWAVNLTTVVLEYDPSNRQYVRQMIQSWHARSLKVTYQGDQGYTQASMLFSRTTAREYTTQLVPSADMLWYSLGIPVVIITKILSLMFPTVEQVLLQIFHQIQLKGLTMVPWVVSLIQGWRHSSIALVLYLVRLRYCAWLLASPRNAPLTDLKGMLKDPYNYKTSFQKTGWITVTLFIIQEILLGCLLAYDAFQVAGLDGRDGQGGQPTLYRRVSFRIRSAAESAADMALDLLPHAREVFMATARIIFIERTIFEISYIIFDILQISVQMTTPSSWSWSLFIQATCSVFGHVLANMAIQIYGPGGFLSLLFQFWLLSKVWGWLKLSLIIKIIFRHTIANPILWVYGLIKLPFMAIYAVYSHCVSTAAWLVSELAAALGPTGTVLLVASILVAFFALFIVVMTDPLQLRHAAFSCAKASRVAAQVTGVREPLKSLNWKASSCKLIEQPPLVDLDLLGELGTTETNKLSASKASGSGVPVKQEQQPARLPDNLKPNFKATPHSATAPTTPLSGGGVPVMAKPIIGKDRTQPLSIEQNPQQAQATGVSKELNSSTVPASAQFPQAQPVRRIIQPAPDSDIDSAFEALAAADSWASATANNSNRKELEEGLKSYLTASQHPKVNSALRRITRPRFRKTKDE